MRIRISLVLIVCIVNFVLTVVQSHNQRIDQFQSLLDSVAMNNPKKSETYQGILKQEVAREQQAFDAMKEDLWVARNRNANKRINFYRKSIGNEDIIAIKRETHENSLSTDLPEQESDPQATTIRPATTRVDDLHANPDAFYREIVQQTVELMWSQEAHLLQMKIRESSIRRKSKYVVKEMQNILTDTDALFTREMDMLSERYWNPKPDQKHIIPMNAGVIQQFMKNWKRFSDLVDADLKTRANIEIDCKKIKEEMNKALTDLPADYEEIKEQMKVLEKVEERARKARTQGN